MAATYLLCMSIPAQADLRVSHCLFASPSGMSPANDLIVREVYALSFKSTPLIFRNT